MNTIDYYTGFEGEPEIQFILIQGEKKLEKLSIWHGYFDEIVDKVEANQGRWKGLAYYYHLDKGWYEVSPWPMRNISYVLKQLKQVNEDKLSETATNILEEIMILLEKALKHNVDIEIHYF